MATPDLPESAPAPPAGGPPFASTGGAPFASAGGAPFASAGGSPFTSAGGASFASAGDELPDRAGIALLAEDVVPLPRGQAPPLVPDTDGPGDAISLILAVHGDALDPADVSRRLGCAPTLAYRKADALGPTGSWLLEVRGASPADADALVEALLARFPATADFWQPLHRDFTVELLVEIHTAAWHVDFDLSPAALARIAATAAPMRFDLHVHD